MFSFDPETRKCISINGDLGTRADRLPRIFLFNNKKIRPTRYGAPRRHHSNPTKIVFVYDHDGFFTYDFVRILSSVVNRRVALPPIYIVLLFTFQIIDELKYTLIIFRKRLLLSLWLLSQLTNY
jgi:hypothetical protein